MSKASLALEEKKVIPRGREKKKEKNGKEEREESEYSI